MFWIVIFSQERGETVVSGGGGGDYLPNLAIIPVFSYSFGENALLGPVWRVGVGGGSVFSAELSNASWELARLKPVNIVILQQQQQSGFSELYCAH